MSAPDGSSSSYSRNFLKDVADYYEVQAILEAHGVRWRAVEEDYETETASGRFKVNIMLAVAQDEADRTSERIKAAAGYKRAKGEAVGRPALGYIIRLLRWQLYLTALLLFVCLTKE